MPNGSTDRDLGMERLVVIAGPSCSGKSTMIDRLLSGRLPRLAGGLELGPLETWTSLLPKHVSDPPRADAPKVLLHYDLLRRWTRKEPAADYDGDPCLGLLSEAPDLTVVTLWASASVLAARLRQRRSTFHRRLLRGRLWNSEQLHSTAVEDDRPAPSWWRTASAVWRELLRLEAKRRLFRSEDPLRDLYESWLRFCVRTGPRANWIIDTHADLERLLPAASYSLQPKSRPR